MRHGSLFSGIGGFDLAAQWMGWDNVFHCEWNQFGQRILKYYWPKAISYEDITKTDFSIHRGEIDILTGGFPCQPFSHAGKRKGANDDRYLWPEMLRAINEIRPSYVIGENVLGITSMVFEPRVAKVESEKNVEGETIHRTMESEIVIVRICEDLESAGYSVQPIVVPAASVNAPHRRDRVWFVAYSDKCTTRPSRTSGETESNGSKNNDEQSSRRKQTEQRTGCGNVLRYDSDTNNTRLQGRKLNETLNQGGVQREWKIERQPYQSTAKLFESADWNGWPTQPPVCSGDDGLSVQLDGITFSKWRRESLKAYGNAIVPQVAFELFKGIEQIESQHNL